MSPKHVVMFSGGVSSWAAARRVADRHGTADMVLLFCDTKMEDEDLYRFLRDASANIGVPVTTIADGRDPWQVFHDERFLGNSRTDPCSKILKRQMLDRWLNANCDQAKTVCYVGIDWTEIHRFERLESRRLPWIYKAPLCERPLMAKPDQLRALSAAGVAPPRLYAMGFSHNNCGGFCIKAGNGHFANLLRHMPARYAYHEAKEQEMREFLGRPVTILKDCTLRELREKIEARGEIDMFDIGGCGCMSDEDTEKGFRAGIEAAALDALDAASGSKENA